MATTAEVEMALISISNTIRTERKNLKDAVAKINTAVGNLNLIPTTFSDAIATIDAYLGADTFETLSQDKKARLASEFTALKAAATTAYNAVSGIDFDVE